MLSRDPEQRTAFRITLISVCRRFSSGSRPVFATWCRQFDLLSGSRACLSADDLRPECVVATSGAIPLRRARMLGGVIGGIQENSGQPSPGSSGSGREHLRNGAGIPDYLDHSRGDLIAIGINRCRIRQEVSRRYIGRPSGIHGSTTNIVYVEIHR